MMNMLVINNQIRFHTQKQSWWTINENNLPLTTADQRCVLSQAFCPLPPPSHIFIVISRLSFWSIILPFQYHQGYQCYQWFSLYFPRWYHIPTYLSIWTPAPLVVEAETLNINGVHPAFAKTCLIKTWHKLVSVTRPFLPYKMINDNIVKASSVSI